MLMQPIGNRIKTKKRSPTFWTEFLPGPDENLDTFRESLWQCAEKGVSL
jgi:hypothetical protein